MAPTARFDFDGIVIGGGPGGLVASIYLRRFRRNVALVTWGAPRALGIPRTHNLMGFDKGVTGDSLLKRLNRHLAKLGSESFTGEAQVKPLKGGGFNVNVGRENLRTRNVIFATGITDIDPHISGLEQLKRRGLLRYCPICDAYEHRDRRIGVLVRDTPGLRRGMFLAHYSKKLTLIAPHDARLSARELELARCMGIHVERATLESVDCTANGKKVAVEFTDRERTVFDVLYSEYGSTVNDLAFRELNIRRNREGRVIINREQSTSVEGTYAVGDCTEGLSQLAVAASQGAIAATALHNGLRYHTEAESLRAGPDLAKTRL